MRFFLHFLSNDHQILSGDLLLLLLLLLSLLFNRSTTKRARFSFSGGARTRCTFSHISRFKYRPPRYNEIQGCWPLSKTYYRYRKHERLIRTKNRKPRDFEMKLDEFIMSLDQVFNVGPSELTIEQESQYSAQDRN